MKLLRDQVETIDRDGIKLSIKAVSTSMQARLMDLASDSSIDGNLKMVAFILRNCVESIEINGESFKPEVLADRADVSDTDTLRTMLEIGKIGVDSIFVSGKDEKKS